MPPKRSRTTRAAAHAEAAATEEDVVAPQPVVEDGVDGVNHENGVSTETDPPPTTPIEPKENGPQVNGKSAPKSAAQKKREKRKQRRREGSVMSEVSDAESVLLHCRSLINIQVASSVTVGGGRERSVSILDTVETELDTDDPAYSQFRKVFNRFAVDDEGDDQINKDAPGKGEIYYSDDDDVPMAEDEDTQAAAISRKRARKLNRPSVAHLKQIVDKPEIVEWTDVSAADPTLLIHLRGYRNMIRVPDHWGQKRDYLASKRGVAKQPYELPSFHSRHWNPRNA